MIVKLINKQSRTISINPKIGLRKEKKRKDKKQKDKKKKDKKQKDKKDTDDDSSEKTSPIKKFSSPRVQDLWFPNKEPRCFRPKGAKRLLGLPRKSK